MIFSHSDLRLPRSEMSYKLPMETTGTIPFVAKDKAAGCAGLFGVGLEYSPVNGAIGSK